MPCHVGVAGSNLNSAHDLVFIEFHLAFVPFGDKYSCSKATFLMPNDLVTYVVQEDKPAICSFIA